MVKALLFCAAMLLPQILYPLTARLQRDTGNAAAVRPVQGDLLEASDSVGSIAYNLYARRDEFSGERTLLNAAVLVYSGLTAGDHQISFGLGSHYRQEKVQRLRAGQGTLQPALGFFWSHPQFRADASGSEHLTRISVSGLIDVGLPLELNTDFERIHSQPYRWSANAFFFVSRYGGVISGYEPLSQRLRAGLWFAPVKELRLSALSRFGANETFFEFALAFQFEPAPEKAVQLPRYHANSDQPEEDDQPKKWRSQKPKSVPPFAVLVKWGLSPVEALQFTREKDACALSEQARRALHKKNWGCRDA